MDSRNIFITADGSATIFNRVKNEHYHSVHGAVQESMHVFIRAGLHNLIEKKLNNSSQPGCITVSVLEIGFGTGLNALLTLLEQKKFNKSIDSDGHFLQINYTALEPCPVERDLINGLNYCEILAVVELQATFENMHELLLQDDQSNISNNKFMIAPGFNFSSVRCTFQEFILSDLKEQDIQTGYDLVYFDAFSPDTEPSLWTKEVFSKLYTMMNRGGVLVTYCSKGVVRRMMQECGFRVERIKGPPGKYEMLRGLRDEALTPWPPHTT